MSDVELEPSVVPATDRRSAIETRRTRGQGSARSDQRLIPIVWHEVEVVGEAEVVRGGEVLG